MQNKTWKEAARPLSRTPRFQYVHDLLYRNAAEIALVEGRQLCDPDHSSEGRRAWVLDLRELKRRRTARVPGSASAVPG
jgi:hypothetical protein